MEQEWKGESSYSFRRPILNSHLCCLDTTKISCQSSLQGSKQVTEKEAKTIGRKTLNMERDIKCREPCLFLKVGK